MRILEDIANGASCTSQETPEAFPLPSDVAIARADAGWAHCVAITGMQLIIHAKLSNLGIASFGIGTVLINIILDQMKGLSIHGVGKNVFQLEGSLQTKLQLELWKRMKDRAQLPTTKVTMLTTCPFSVLH